MIGCDGGRGDICRQLSIAYRGRNGSGHHFYDGAMLSIYVRAPAIAEVRRMPVSWHYWTILVVAERFLPTGQKNVGLSRLERIAGPCGAGELKRAVENVCPAREYLKAVGRTTVGGS